MSESRTWAIIEALAAQLGTISQAAGYLTDVGSSVWTNDHQRPSEDALGLMLYSESIVGAGADRERPGKPVRTFSVLIEAEISAGLDNAQQQIHAVIEDIDACIESYAKRWPMPQRGVTAFHVEDFAILDRPEGVAVVAMQARIVASYFR